MCPTPVFYEVHLTDRLYNTKHVHRYNGHDPPQVSAGGDQQRQPGELPRSAGAVVRFHWAVDANLVHHPNLGRLGPSTAAKREAGWDGASVHPMCRPQKRGDAFGCGRADAWCLGGAFVWGEGGPKVCKR